MKRLTRRHPMHRSATWLRQAIFAGSFTTCLLTASSSWSQDKEIGTAATLEWLQKKPAQRDMPPAKQPSLSGLGGHAAGFVADKVASLSPQPIPAFKYRFWPSRLELHAGSAETHFYRAILQRVTTAQGLNKNQSDQLNQILGLDLDQIPIDAAKEWVEQFDSTFYELEAMSESEDLSWDLRFRDLQGKNIWNIRLEDVQQARVLVRMLQLKIVSQVAKKDYAGAANSIRIGLRLAAFVGQGESVIQGLVGIAIESSMYSAVDYVIRSPESPNLYWALQTLPPNLVPIEDAVEIELGMIFPMFPILRESEATTLSDQELMQRLRQSISDLRQAIGNNSVPFNGADSIGLMLTLSAADAKSRLKESGYDPEKLARLTPLQASLVDAGRELKIRTDELLKGTKVRGPEGNALRTRLHIENERWASSSTGTAAGMIASLLLPATQNIYDASLRVVMQRHRLVTAEALRAYAAAHQGRLPASLDELTDTPAALDPFTQKPFGYRVEKQGDSQVVTLTSQTPERFASFAEVKFLFPSARP